MTWARRFTPVAAGFSIVLGLLVLVGWYTHTLALIQIHPMFAGMQYNTALGFLSCGLGLLALHQGWSRTAIAAAAVALSLGAATSIEYLFTIDLGIDQLIMSADAPIENPYPGRMGLNTAVCFSLLNLALLLLAARRPSKWHRHAAGVSAAAVLILALTVVLAYLTRLFLATGWGMFTQMAFHTSIGFVVLALGTLGYAWRGPVDPVNNGTIRSSGTTASIGAPLAWVVLTGSLTLSLWIWYASIEEMQKDGSQRFEKRTQQIESAIQFHMQQHEQLLLGASGLFAASQHVDRHDWRAFMEAQHINERYPGILGVGFSQRILPKDLAAHVRRIRAEGFPHYTLWPGGQREEYHSIVYLESFDDSHRRAFGYDMYTESIRRAAMAQARDTGRPMLSGKVALIQETGKDTQAGFLLYAPVYRHDLPTVTVAQRRAALIGFTYSPYRANDLMRSILGQREPDIALWIFDDMTSAPETLLYDDTRDNPLPTGYRPRFTRSRVIELAGRSWTLQFASRPAFDATVLHYYPTAALLTGIVISFLLFGIVWSLSTTRTRAVALAEAMTGKLRESEQRWHFALEGSQNGVWDWNMQTNEVFFSKRWKEMLGFGEHEISNRLEEWDKRVHPDDKARVYADVEKHMKAETAYYENEHRVLCKDGAYKWILDRGMIVERDGNGKATRMIGTHTDITGRKRDEEAIREMSHTDELTGLRNRRGFFALAEQQFKLTYRNKQELFMFFLDLDGLKTINDALGHGVGDEALVEASGVLRKTFWESDIIARLGGDEFAVLVLNCNLEGAKVVMARLHNNIKAQNDMAGRRYPLAFSVGMEHFDPEAPCTVDELVVRADKTMYQDKKNKRRA